MTLLHPIAIDSQDPFRALQSAQLVHWAEAIDRLGQLDHLASEQGWASLERRTGVLIRSTLRRSVQHLADKADALRRASNVMPTDEVAAGLQDLRRDYLRTETMLDFYIDAVNSRGARETSELLSALDTLAEDSMKRFLAPLGHPVPPVITYLDRGLGASILKAGFRLWDLRSLSPAAAIKVVRHNLATPTALFHEAGHQIAHMTGWNQALAKALYDGLPRPIRRVWASWASEVGADAIAFVLTGFASVAALRNVVDGGRRQVFQFVPGDPHPIGFVRVLLGLEMCRRAFGRAGPWQELEDYWWRLYPLSDAPRRVGALIAASIPHLPRIVEIVNHQRFGSFGDTSLNRLIPTDDLSPAALDQFETQAGPEAFATPSIIRRHSARLIALSGLRMAQSPVLAGTYYDKQQIALRTLGAQVQVA